MFITSQQKMCNLNDASPHLKRNNIDLKLSNGDKILGTNIDKTLIWDSHYKYIVKKDIHTFKALVSNFFIFS